MYRTMMLNSGGLVSFYVGGDMTDGYKRKCLLLLANYFFTSFVGSSCSRVHERYAILIHTYIDKELT